MAKVNYERFVTLWKQNKTSDEIAHELQISLANVYAVAKKLREAGVKLPQRVRPKDVIDADSLNRLLSVQ